MRIDPDADVPPYEQVRSHFAQAIASRELAVGAKLPTVRALARDLGLAVNTVARAYRELEESGLVETRGRAGTVVSSAGDRSRERVVRAARVYATTTAEMGVGPDEALEIVKAALSL